MTPRIGASVAAAAELVDSAVAVRVLVHGSLRPDSRDLDLLAREREAQAVADALTAAGFRRRGLEFARFRNTTAELVDVVPAADWALPEEELAALFDDALPIEGYARLVRPAPHHLLLALARRIVEGSGRLDARRRSYVDDALAEDPDAWRRAYERAAAWGGPEELQLLERAWRDGVQPRLSRRIAAMVARQRRRGIDPLRARIATWRYVAKPPHKGSVIALSGIDGSGKSTHAHLLHDALETLGYDVQYEWNKLATNAWLWRLRPYAAKAVYLATPSRKRPADAAAPRVAAEPAPWGTDVPPDAATLLRERSALLSHAWVSLVAIANAVAHQRAVLRHVARGRVVICDRYTLDSLVHVSTRFGEARSWRFERALVRALSPRPLKAYFLDVPAEIAWSRKQEDDPAWLERLAERYRAEHASVGAERVDGAQPLEDVAAALAESAWRALG